MKAQKIEISYKTIIFTILVLLSMLFIWQIRSIILEFLIAVIIMSALNPIVNKYENKKIGKIKLSRTFAILIVYSLVTIFIFGLILLITRPLIDQTSNLIRFFPALLEKSNLFGIDESFIERQISQLNTLPRDIFVFIGGLFSNLLSVFTTFVMSFYLLLERDKLHKHLASLFGNQDIENRVSKFFDDLEENLGGWVRVEVLLMLIVGILTYIGLSLLKIPYALPLAIIAGVLEILPNIGPTISAVPAIIVALFISPIVALGVAALYIIVQILENNLIVPQLMSKTFGVNPLVTIVTLLVGFNIGGVKGAILAIPIVLIVKSVIIHFFATKLKSANKTKS